MWIYLGIVSAVFLGLYEISKKHALQANAVLPVLFLGSVFGAAIMIPEMAGSLVWPAAMAKAGLYVGPLPWVAHLHILAKAAIVSVSWVLAYFALKHLPISVVSPIRASEPIWTLAGAIFLFAERPSRMQWAGLIVIIGAYYAFSVIGSKEGISFVRNKWVWCILAAGVVGAVSSLYDKFLIHTLGYSPMAVQAWFSVYLVPLLGAVMAAFWRPGRKGWTAFEWRWSIVMIGAMLIVADFAYFRAIGCDGALISLLAAIRRGSVLVAFFGGVAMFNDVNMRYKSAALAGVLGGVMMILFST